MKDKSWGARPPSERCYSSPPDRINANSRSLYGGCCLRKGGHSGLHNNGKRTWSFGDLTSQPSVRQPAEPDAPDLRRPGDRSA